MPELLRNVPWKMVTLPGAAIGGPNFENAALSASAAMLLSCVTAAGALPWF
jgi:hypothetical protein